MGRRSRPGRPGRVSWVVAFLVLAILLTTALAGSEQPEYVTHTHEEKPFRIDIPEGWTVEWDYPVGPYRSVDMVALGPLENSYRTNVGVDSKWANVTESEDYLIQAAEGLIADVHRSHPVAIVRPPTVVDTLNTRAAVFVIGYEGRPVSQVIAVVGSQILERVWFIIGTSASATAEKNEPVFQAVIASFEVITGPELAYMGPLSSPLLFGASAGSAALLGAWILYRRRHEVVSLVRGIRDEGRIPGQIEVPPEGGVEVEGMLQDPERP